MRKRASRRLHVALALQAFLCGGAIASGCDLGLSPFAPDADVPSLPDSSDGALPDASPKDASTLSDADAGSKLDAADAKAVAKVFVSSTVLPGSFGGVPTADNLCRQLALGAGLEGKYVAWLSTTASGAAITRIVEMGGWYLVDGVTLVFPNRASLRNSAPLVPIDQTESGRKPDTAPVWTGTTAAGAVAANCANFTSADPAIVGEVGTTLTIGPRWTDDGPAPCNAPARIYCFGQP